MALSTLPQKVPRLITRHPQESSSATARWQAVLSRDATVNHFVYAVLTTKIYCRPSCPGRLARRANVRFYDTPSQAELAGFRACKRCKPQAAGNPQTQLILKACATIESAVHIGTKPTFRKLADEANLTPSHFHRLFKKTMGVTPGQYAAALMARRSRMPLNKDGVDENPALVQPCAWDFLYDHCTLSDPGEAELSCWNDFDALIAAEAEFAAVTESIQSANGLVPMSAMDVPVATEVLDWDALLNSPAPGGGNG